MAVGAQCRAVALHVKRQKPDAETWKHLGHGPCDSLTRSAPLPRATADPAAILAACTTLLAAMAVPPDRVRGVGLMLHRLGRAGGAVAALGVPGTSDVGGAKAAAGTADITRYFAAPAAALAPAPVAAPAVVTDDAEDVVLADSPPVQSTPSRWDPAVVDALPPDVVEVGGASRLCLTLSSHAMWSR